jgi:CheY-like chemotaxis protein
MDILKSILLAEDDEKDIVLTMTAFKQNNLLNKVVAVHDGEEALDYLFYKNKFASREKGNPAVILLDIKMPKIDGLEVLKRIKQDINLKKIPVVILTSSGEEKDLATSYNLGANSYVVKPVNFNEFIEAVKQLGLYWAVINQAPPGSVAK